MYFHIRISTISEILTASSQIEYDILKSLTCNQKNEMKVNKRININEKILQHYLCFNITIAELLIQSPDHTKTNDDLWMKKGSTLILSFFRSRKRLRSVYEDERFTS